MSEDLQIGSRLFTDGTTRPVYPIRGTSRTQSSTAFPAPRANAGRRVTRNGTHSHLAARRPIRARGNSPPGGNPNLPSDSFSRSRSVSPKQRSQTGPSYSTPPLQKEATQPFSMAAFLVPTTEQKTPAPEDRPRRRSVG